MLEAEFTNRVAERHLSESGKLVPAASRAEAERTIFVVLGTHRSGTSVCAHLLQALGIDMADDPMISASNQKGHWERGEIVQLHDELLRAFHRHVFDVSHDLPLPSDWNAQPVTRSVKDRLKALLREGMAKTPYFGFKDPRTVRLLPMWHEIFRDLSLSPRYIMCLRNPAQVARSLNSRDGIDVALGEYRWLTHVMDFFRYTRNRPTCILEYEAWFPDPTVNLRRLMEFTGFASDRIDLDLHVLASDVVERGLRHDPENLFEARNPIIRSTYKIVRQGATDSQVDIDGLLETFIAFEQFIRPFQNIIERHEELLRLEPEVAALQQSHIETRNELEAARAGLAASQSIALALHDRTTELEATKRELIALRTTAETLYERTAELAATRAELAASRAALATLHDRTVELAAQLESRQTVGGHSTDRMDSDLGASDACQETTAVYEARLAAHEHVPVDELMTASDSDVACAKDQLHVRNEMPNIIAGPMVTSSAADRKPTDPEYHEDDYLRANPDVEAAVVRGVFATGYEHWLCFGRAEGRRLSP